MQDSSPHQGELVLRDIHQVAAPSWWPPAPGWWAVAFALLALVVVYAFWRHRRRNRRQRIVAIFDEAIAGAHDAPAQVAVMSELLRRAARLRDPAADRLEGDAWLSFLDADDPRRPFSEGAARLLLDGGFRRDLDRRQVEALRAVARERFLAWMVK